MKKKLLAYCLILAMLLAMAPTVFAADDTAPLALAANDTGDTATLQARYYGYCGGDDTAEYDQESDCYTNLIWELNTDIGELTIMGNGAMCDWSSSSLVPWSAYTFNIKTVKIINDVTTIGGTAFAGCHQLDFILIPDSLTTIGSGAFSDCTSLESITIPGSVTTIGDWVFSGCYRLESVTIPNSVTTIGYRMFSGCTSLESITIPNSVTTIGEGAFSGCTSLESVTIPNSVTTIGEGAFSGCTSLESITIPDSVATIGEGAFDGCSSLTGIAVSPENRNFSSQDGVLYNKDKTALIRCPCGKAGIFTIPDSVTTIGEGAFDGCSSLTGIAVSPENRNFSSQDGVLYNKDKTALIRYPCGKAGIFTIPDSVTTIGERAFYVCGKLTNVTIGNSVTTVGCEAFEGCNNLTYNVYDNGKYLGNAENPNLYLAKAVNSSITSCAIHPETRLIGSDAFSYCHGLTSITMGNSVTTIGDSAFCCCTSLESITIPDSVTTIGDWVFSGCDKLTGITIPDSVTTIGEGAFSDCTSLESITIPDSVTTIGEGAFDLCSSLTGIAVSPENRNYCSQDGVLLNKDKTALIRYPCGKAGIFTIPDSVTTISRRAFRLCTSLTGVIIPDGVTAISDDTFCYCGSLTRVTIPGSVTTIGEGAFDGCDSLTSVTIPDGVTAIGNWGFSGCTSLTDVYYGGTEAQWQQITFGFKNDPLLAAAIHYETFCVNYKPVGDVAFRGDVKDGKKQLTFTITPSSSLQSQNASVTAALYKGDCMVGIATARYTAGQDTLTLTVAADKDYDSFKIIALNDFSALTPLLAVTEISPTP